MSGILWVFAQSTASGKEGSGPSTETTTEPEVIESLFNPNNRVILALHDTSEGGRWDESYIHKCAEMPLNHLGCKLRYHDVAKGLPTEADMEGVRGILTWYMDDSMMDAAAYCHWLRGLIEKGLPCVIIENLGAREDLKTKTILPEGLPNSVLMALGLETGGFSSTRNLKIRVKSKDSSMVEFERSLDGPLKYFREIRARHFDSKVYLTLLHLDAPKALCDAVVTTPRGGYVETSYALASDPDSPARQWRIDPFRFFTEAYRLQDNPRPDVTTRNGRRLWFSHIDGDALTNGSFLGADILSGQVIMDRILKRYKLPFTVSIVTGLVDEAGLGTPEVVSMAREMLSLPNVEPACHGHAHPAEWEECTLTLTNVPNAPDYSSQREITYATNYINTRLLSKDQSVKIYLWTGDCRPKESDIAITRKQGLLNINGGDTRMYGLFSSYTWVAPLTRQVGSHLQVYSGMANENIFTGLFTDPLYGFVNVIDTINNTESPACLGPGRQPRRVCPINIYFHFYIADKLGAFNSLVKVIDASTKGPIAPCYASDYARSVEGAMDMTWTSEGPGLWRVRNFGNCRTLRFDDAVGGVDLERCKGVWGFKRLDTRLWVHLAEGEEALIQLKTSGDTGNRPYLEEATPLITQFKPGADRIELAVDSLEPGEIVLAGVSGTWRIEGGETVDANGQGRLALSLSSGSHVLTRSP
ncbi:MAG: hypothetical protein AB7F75_01670 [Planctomycetota bacterium]